MRYISFKFAGLLFEYVPKTPGHKFSVFWGRDGSLNLYIGTNSHRFKLYFFRDNYTPNS